VRHLKPFGPGWILALALLLPGCTQNRPAPAPTAPQSVKLGEPVVLAPGRSATVGDAGLILYFDAIAQDSRCPQGVECFWQGDAAASLSATLPGVGTTTAFVLHTFPGFQTVQDYQGYRIALTRVDPYPVYPNEIAPGDYRATVTVTAP